MNTERKAQIIASIGTVVIAVLMLLSFTVIYLTVPAHEVSHKADISLLTEDEEMFVEIIEPDPIPVVSNNPAQAYTPEEEHNQAKPTPAAGTDLVDNGPKGDPPPVVASKQPSPVKVNTDKPKTEGPVVDKKKQEEEAVQRQAQNEVAAAMRNASGHHNAVNGAGDTGNAGSNKGSRQGTTGTGTGNVGGGWIIPKYAPVKSTVTGSIDMVVKIDKDGYVVSVSFSGGNPPAATDSAVRKAVEREIRAHKFSRTNYDDATEATAYITYTFK